MFFFLLLFRILLVIGGLICRIYWEDVLFVFLWFVLLLQIVEIFGVFGCLLVIFFLFCIFVGCLYGILILLFEVDQNCKVRKDLWMLQLFCVIKDLRFLGFIKMLFVKAISCRWVVRRFIEGGLRLICLYFFLQFICDFINIIE